MNQYDNDNVYGDNSKKESVFKEQFLFFPQVKNAYALYHEHTQKVKGYDFFQFVLEEYDKKQLNFSEKDLDLIIEHKFNPSQKHIELAVIKGRQNQVPLTHSQLHKMLSCHDFVLSDMTLFYLLSFEQEIALQLSHQEIFKIFQNNPQFLEPKNAQSNLVEAVAPLGNLLHRALFYGSLGKTKLTLEHYDFLFAHFEYNIDSIGYEKVKSKISKSKETYDILKENLRLKYQLKINSSNNENVENILPKAEAINKTFKI